MGASTGEEVNVRLGHMQLPDWAMFLIAAMFILGCGAFFYHRARQANRVHPLLIGVAGGILWIAAVAGQTTFIDHTWKPRWWRQLLSAWDDHGAFMLFFFESAILVILLGMMVLKKGATGKPTTARSRAAARAEERKLRRAAELDSESDGSTK
jgi:chromate transport protein ChrA